MSRLLIRLLFRLARKFAFKELELFLAEYAKGRFNYLLSPPETPEITEFPEVTLSSKNEDEEDKSGNSLNKVVKEVTISVGSGVLLLSQLKTSGGEVGDAERELESAAEDWNGDVLPVFAAVGSGISSVIDEIEIPEVKVPDLDLPQIPTYEPVFGDKTDEIRKNYGKEKKGTAESGEGGTVTGGARSEGGWNFITRVSKPSVKSGVMPTFVSRDKMSVTTRDGETVIKRHGQEWRVQRVRVGQSFDSLLQGYTYDSRQQSIGATGAFFGGESGRMRKITKIILHCTADPEGRDHTLEYYNSEHLQRDNGTWIGVGYHFIIHPDGTIESARPVNMIGSHCKGQNAVSIGIAYIGGMDKEYKNAKDTRTRAQKRQMWRLVLFLLQRFPSATVHGHHEYDPKPCPCFDVKSEFSTLMNNGFDIDALYNNYMASTEIIESSSQYGDGLGTQKSDMPVFVTND